MSNFGPNGASGSVPGSASAVYVKLDFEPQLIQIYNLTSGPFAFWVKGMAQDSAFGLADGGGGGSSRQTDTATVTANVMTLTQSINFPISQAYAVTAGATGAKVIIPDGRTPAAGQVVIVDDTHIQFAAADAVTEGSITYITEGGGGGGGPGEITPNAIISGNSGFSIGTGLQQAGDTIFWVAIR
jgi:hypothetical protein